MKYKSFITLFSLPLLLAACSGNDGLADMAQQDVVPDVSTRGTDGVTTNWKKGDKIALFKASGTMAKNFVFNDINWNPEDGNNLKATLPATFYGVYPATGNDNFLIPADQSTADKLHSADFMSTGNVELGSAKDPLNLVFKHLLCKVDISIKEYKNEFGGTIPTITNPRFYSGLAVNRKVGTNGVYASLAESEKHEVTPVYTESQVDGKHKFEAIIAQGVYGNGFFSVEVNGKRTEVAFSGNTDISMESGYSYHFDLVVGKEFLQLNLTNVTDYAGAWRREEGIDYVPPKIGDYLYDDGTYGVWNSSKKAIGVVFSTTTTQKDQDAGYFRGYAIAMNQSAQRVKFKTTNTTDGYGNMGWGRTFPLTIECNRDGLTMTKSLNNDEHPVFKEAVAYKSRISKDISSWASDWFVPAYGQWCNVFINLGGISETPYDIYPSWTKWRKISLDKLNSYFVNRSGATKIVDDYWTSSYNNNEAQEIDFSSITGIDMQEVTNTSLNYVRPAIAF
jgi:hypothetical protein